MNNQLVFYTLAVILLLVISVEAEHTFQGTDVKEYSQTNLHSETGIGLGKKRIKDDYFIMFYAKWCPHCRNFQPVWIELKKKHPNDGIIAVHCPDNHDLCESFNVQGYPTLLLISKDKYQYCRFDGIRQINDVDEFWKNKCKIKPKEGSDDKPKTENMFDINFRVSQVDVDEDDEDEDDEHKTSLDGNSGSEKSLQEGEEDVAEEEKGKIVKNFKNQKNKAYQDKIMKVKDYLKKLGPLTMVVLIGLCIISVTFVCNKCCTYDQEDPFTKKIIRTVEKKSRQGYSQTKSNDRSQYV